MEQDLSNQERLLLLALEFEAKLGIPVGIR
jgi:hypothetical protein